MPAKFRQTKLTHEVRAELMPKALALHRQGLKQREIAAQLRVSQPTVCMWLRKQRLGLATTVQERVADKIRAELVCCDIYQRMEDVSQPGMEDEWRALRHGSDYHDLCFFGEWSARLALAVK